MIKLLYQPFLISGSLVGVSGDLRDLVFDVLRDFGFDGVALGGRGPGILDGNLLGEVGDVGPCFFCNII